MTKLELQFVIDQLRKDKIIYAVEATAVNMLCFVVMLASSVILAGTPVTQLAVFSIAVIVAASYTAYMGVGNYKRLMHIKELESKLYRE